MVAHSLCQRSAVMVTKRCQCGQVYLRAECCRAEKPHAQAAVPHALAASAFQQA